VITPWLAEASEWLGLDALAHLIISGGFDRVHPHDLPSSRRDAVAHIMVTFVQDGSWAYHQSCAAFVALSRHAIYCDADWSGESLPLDLCCAACGRTIAQPLQASSDGAEHPRGAWKHAAETRVHRHSMTAPWPVEHRTG